MGCVSEEKDMGGRFALCGRARLWLRVYGWEAGVDCSGTAGMASGVDVYWL